MPELLPPSLLPAAEAAPSAFVSSCCWRTSHRRFFLQLTLLQPGSVCFDVTIFNPIIIFNRYQYGLILTQNRRLLHSEVEESYIIIKPNAFNERLKPKKRSMFTSLGGNQSETQRLVHKVPKKVLPDLGCCIYRRPILFNQILICTYKGERKLSILAGYCIVFVLHVIGVYWWYQNDDLCYPLFMFPPKEIPPFWNAIFTIIVNDTMVRQAAMAFKLVLLMYYKNGRSHSFRRQGQMPTLVEYTLLLYLAFLPAPVWYRFFLNKEYEFIFTYRVSKIYGIQDNHTNGDEHHDDEEEFDLEMEMMNLENMEDVSGNEAAMPWEMMMKVRVMKRTMMVNSNQQVCNGNAGGLFPKNRPIVAPGSLMNYLTQPFPLQNTTPQFPMGISGFNPQQNFNSFPVNHFNPSQQQQGQFFANNSMNRPV
ncbi:hypothetical protein L1887_08872 [Cichorium endivia]|nr:hypothetical protein L1887_08872 [Cichorium endivia]